MGQIMQEVVMLVEARLLSSEEETRQAQQV